MLPNPDLLIVPFLRREAVSSSRIEGTVTNLEQLLLFEADPSDSKQSNDQREVANYVVALRFGLVRLSNLPVSLRSMCEVHERLMNGVRGEDKRPGQFRDRQNMIDAMASCPERPDSSRRRSNEMRVCLDALEKYTGKPSKLPPLIDLALIHYQFETIHPFLDGNGRLGRLLISLLLCERRCLPQPLLDLSGFRAKSKHIHGFSIGCQSTR